MSGEAAVYLRLLVPALVGWVAWAVYRAPYQERSNRLLATFLVVIAIEFLLESTWLMVQGTAASMALVVRWAQFVLGLVDPPLLVACAVTFPRPPQGGHALAWTVAGATAGCLFVVALAVGHDQDLNFTSPWVGAAAFAYVGGAYLAAFAILLRRFVRERRRFMVRQLFYLALGTGVVALSRMAAAFLPGGVGLPPPAGLGPVAAGAAVVAVGYAATCLLARRWATGEHSPLRLLGALGALLVTFLGAWAALQAAAPAALTFLFGLRWVFFALVVGYGILRYQIFDLQAETWNTVSYLVAVLVGVLVSVRVDRGLGAGIGSLGTHGVAVAAGAAAMATSHLFLRQAGRLLRREQAGQPQRHILLDIYEATLEYATESRPPSDAERRLEETLRELFEVSPDEHRRIMARLKGQG